MKKTVVWLASVLILVFGIALSYGQGVSEEARRHFDRGMAALDMAKSPAECEPAIKEFEQAARLAPDWPNAFYNLGAAQAKAEKYGDAVRSFQQYLRLAPNADDAEGVKSIINKLEYKAEQFISDSEALDIFASLGGIGGGIGQSNDKWNFSGEVQSFGTAHSFRRVGDKIEFEYWGGRLGNRTSFAYVTGRILTYHSESIDGLGSLRHNVAMEIVTRSKIKGSDIATRSKERTFNFEYNLKR